MKRVLVTGENSYIGTALENWLMREPSKYNVDVIDMKSEAWRDSSFEPYDVVFHVAGIAHVSSDPKMEDLYYQVNRDLTIDTAKKSKKDGVKQFIFMSSIIVYGDSKCGDRMINQTTEPSPSNFYGNSKLQAEQGIKKLESDQFKIVILRPPMIYGKGSKGNYPKLAKMAQKTPIFPNIKNERSMLHIDNLCEFIKVMMDYNENGIFFPQNKEYVNTSELVQIIADLHGKKLRLTKVFNPVIKLMFGLSTIKKVFGNLTYDQSMSKYEDLDYQIREFKESIKLTEE